MGSFGREPPVLWAPGGVRADGLRPGEGGNRRFQKSAGGLEKAALKILRFTHFVVSQAWDLVKKDTLSPKLASSRSLQ